MDDTFKDAAEELEDIAGEYEQHAEQSEGFNYRHSSWSGNSWAKYYRSEAASFRRAAQHLRAAYEQALEHE